MRVVVVGAGLGGLAAAAHLSNRGHDITIVERDATPGGRAGMVIADGFRLDNGPTVLTMPNLLADAFNAAGADMADGGNGTTTLDWHGTAEMRGPVAAVGGRVLDAQAQKIISQTFRTVREKLSA